MEFLTNINLIGNELQSAVIHPLTADPLNGEEGQIYYNTTEKTLKIHNGDRFVAVGNKITSTEIEEALIEKGLPIHSVNGLKEALENKEDKGVAQNLISQSEMELKTHVDEEIRNAIESLKDGAGEEYDTLKEIEEFIKDNRTAIENLKGAKKEVFTLNSYNGNHEGTINHTLGEDVVVSLYDSNGNMVKTDVKKERNKLTIINTKKTPLKVIVMG